MSADLKSLFPATPALKSVLRAEDLGAETLARHLPWLSAPADDLILTRQGDLLASALVDGMDSFTVEEGELALVPASLARFIGQLGEGFGYHVSKLTLPALKPATSRNLNTVRKLAELAAAMEKAGLKAGDQVLRVDRERLVAGQRAAVNGFVANVELQLVAGEQAAVCIEIACAGHEIHLRHQCALRLTLGQGDVLFDEPDDIAGEGGDLCFGERDTGPQ